MENKISYYNDGSLPNALELDWRENRYKCKFDLKMLALQNLQEKMILETKNWSLEKIEEEMTRLDAYHPELSERLIRLDKLFILAEIYQQKFKRRFLYDKYYLKIVNITDNYDRYLTLDALRAEVQITLIYHSIAVAGLHKLFDFNDFDDEMKSFLYFFFTDYCPKHLVIFKDEARDLLKSYIKLNLKNMMSEEEKTNLIKWTKHNIIMLKHINILINNFSEINLSRFKNFILDSTCTFLEYPQIPFLQQYQEPHDIFFKNYFRSL